MDRFLAFMLTVVTTLWIVFVIILAVMDIWSDEATLSGVYILGLIFGIVTVFVCHFLIECWKN